MFLLSFFLRRPLALIWTILIIFQFINFLFFYLVNYSSSSFSLSNGTTVSSASKRPSLDQDETKTEKIKSFSLSISNEMVETPSDLLPRYVDVNDGPQLAHY
jgi:hypothetical protein